MAVQLPVARGISVDTTGAEIIAEDSPAVSYDACVVGCSEAVHKLITGHVIPCS
jgi:hypothetical protein